MLSSSTAQQSSPHCGVIARIRGGDSDASECSGSGEEATQDAEGTPDDPGLVLGDPDDQNLLQRISSEPRLDRVLNACGRIPAIRDSVRSPF